MLMVPHATIIQAPSAAKATQAMNSIGMQVKQYDAARGIYNSTGIFINFVIPQSYQSTSIVINNHQYSSVAIIKNHQ